MTILRFERVLKDQKKEKKKETVHNRAGIKLPAL